MKKFLIPMLLMAVCIMAGAQKNEAADFKAGNLYYKIIDQKKKLVEVVRKTADYKALTSVIIPTTITTQQGKFKVAQIGFGAFRGCDRLESVVVPKSVTTISDLAFEKCESLNKVTLSKGLTHIGSGAFGYCTGLREIVIPRSVKTIEAEAFTECTGLKTARVGKATKYTDSGVYSNDDAFEYSAFDENTEVVIY